MRLGNLLLDYRSARYVAHAGMETCHAKRIEFQGLVPTLFKDSREKRGVEKKNPVPFSLLGRDRERDPGIHSCAEAFQVGRVQAVDCSLGNRPLRRGLPRCAARATRLVRSLYLIPRQDQQVTRLWKLETMLTLPSPILCQR